MKRILVSGLINIETSIYVDDFPINYCPIEYPFFGVDSCASGVGYNVSKALMTLGSNVELLTEIGDDINGDLVLLQAKKDGINTNHFVKFNNSKTAESVVLIDKNGRRKIYCDLKDIQERKPLTSHDIKIDDYSLAILTNINFNRELLIKFHQVGITIATDVHVLSNIDDEYNSDFMKYANILFLSNEAIVDKEAEFIEKLYEKYHNDIIVCGCGNKGALMYIGKENQFYFEEAIAPYGVKSTIGAGDALFSAFVHLFNKGMDIQKCLKYAVKFAGIKISDSGGSKGFISEKELLKE